MKILIRLVGTGLIAAAIASCASTTPKTTIWRYPEVEQRQFDRVLVIGAFPTEEQRMKIEEQFVQEFSNRKINAIASNPYLPYDQMLSTEIIDTVSREQGAGAVLIIRLLDKKKLRTEYPGGSYPFVILPGGGAGRGKYDAYQLQDYYHATQSGFTVSKEYVVLETGLYAAEGEQIVWRASTSMRVDLNLERAVDDIAREVAKIISQEKLFK